MLVCPQCGAENRAGARFCDTCAAALTVPAEAREQRKTVTVLFCDVTGSTALGETTRPGGAAGAARPLLRADEGDRRAPRRDGREVHRRRRDGRLRRAGACTRTTRCARCGLRSRCATRSPSSGIRGRIGVTTGEVVTGTEERLATGDAVNVAARLEQAARAGRDPDRRRDVPARRATRSRSSRLEPLDAEGEGRAGSGATACSPCTARRAFTRRADAPMVGREREQRQLASAWERVVVGALLPALHDPRCGRRRQVAPRRRVPRRRSTTRWSCAAAASRTARASPTGRWSRSSSSSPAVELGPGRRARRSRALLGERERS